MKLTPQQLHFFNTFGYLVFPGLMADSIGWITDEFEGIFARQTELLPGVPSHNGTARTCIVPFADQSTRLCTLLDDARIVGIASRLMDDDFNYLGGDGNYYVGDTGWHSDGWNADNRYIKIAFYLDPVTRDTGCLRVIPGSHLPGERFAEACQGVPNSKDRFGIEGRDVPAIALESKPGDVVVFAHNLKHASFGGSNRRRMFTLNLCGHCTTPRQIEDLRNYIAGHDRFWIEHLHSDIMRGTASPQRMRHLQQVIDNEGMLTEKARAARARMAEPSRG